jgi:hypothetical protein
LLAGTATASGSATGAGARPRSLARVSSDLVREAQGPEGILRTVYHTQSLSDAHAVRAALLAEGLPATLSGEHSIGTVGGGLAVHVPSEEDATVARRVIATLGLGAQP